MRFLCHRRQAALCSAHCFVVVALPGSPGSRSASSPGWGGGGDIARRRWPHSPRVLREDGAEWGSSWSVRPQPRSPALCPRAASSLSGNPRQVASARGDSRARRPLPPESPGPREPGSVRGGHPAGGEGRAGVRPGTGGEGEPPRAHGTRGTCGPRQSTWHGRGETQAPSALGRVPVAFGVEGGTARASGELGRSRVLRGRSRAGRKTTVRAPPLPRGATSLPPAWSRFRQRPRRSGLYAWREQT